MKDAVNATPRNSHEETVLELVREYASAAHSGDSIGAQRALDEILKLYPPQRKRATIANLTAGCPVSVAKGSQLGHLFTERGFVLNLSEIFGHSALRFLGDDRFDQVFMRSSSGNIYRIRQDLTSGEFTLTNANSGKLYTFPSHFPQDYRITIGAPFAGEIIKDGKPAIRLSSTIVELVLVSAQKNLSRAEIGNIATLGSTIVEEFDEQLRPTASRSYVAPRGAVSVSQGTQLGHSIQKAKLVDLFKNGTGHEAIGPVTHIYIRTASDNIYRFEKDAPEEGYVRVLDMRVSIKYGRLSERIIPLTELASTIFEEGRSCTFGPVSTSPLREIVVVNSENEFSPKQIEEFTDGAKSTIVDDFNRDIRGALQR